MRAMCCRRIGLRQEPAATDGEGRPSRGLAEKQKRREPVFKRSLAFPRLPLLDIRIPLLADFLAMHSTPPRAIVNSPRVAQTDEGVAWEG